MFSSILLTLFKSVNVIVCSIYDQVLTEDCISQMSILHMWYVLIEIVHSTIALW